MQQYQIRQQTDKNKDHHQLNVGFCLRLRDPFSGVDRSYISRHVPASSAALIIISSYKQKLCRRSQRKVALRLTAGQR
jgi:hypothetical protein